ncbi:MAG: DUF5916 domain-containing protein [bacterium]
MHFTSTLLSLAATIMVCTNALAQNGALPPRVEFSLQSAKTEIKIDGRLDDPIWQDAQRLTHFIQREPNYSEPVSEPTEVCIAFDAKNLYIAADMQDREPERVVANVMRRDAELLNNDSFEIYLDTFHDHRNFFYFATNALGAQRDGLIRNEGENQNWDWDGVWESAGQRTSKGWTVEVVIPFKTLRFGSDSAQTWGANFVRRIVRKREESYWSPVARDLGFWGHFKPAHYGHLGGFRGLHQGGAIEAKPFTISGGTKDFEEAGHPLTRQLDFGADAKIHLTANLTADLTLNTDFAQVESDQEQVNLTRFDLFFPEKREFFLENADVFRAGERNLDFEPPSTLLFFSRKIGLTEAGDAVPITGGAKITGKAGKYEIGLLEVLTDQTSYIDDLDTDDEADDELVELPRHNFAVVRVKRDILAKSSIGIIGTSKEGWDNTVKRNSVTRNILSDAREYNRVFAADVNLSFGTGTRFTGFLGKSQTANVHGKDWAGSAFFSHELDRWGISLGYTDIQDNFDAQIGFIQRNGIRKSRVIPYLSQRWKSGPIRQSWFFNDFQYITDQQNHLATRTMLNGLFNLFRNGSELFVATLGTFDALDESFELREGAEVPVGAYSFRNFLGEFKSDQSKRLAASLSFNTGDFYSGKLTALGGGLTLRPNANFSLETQYSRNSIALPIRRGKYATNLAISRVTYSFTPRLFAKVFVQYNDDDDSFNTNFLLNWIHRPGSNFYLVYNDVENMAGARWRGKNRTLLAKFNYLLGW